MRSAAIVSATGDGYTQSPQRRPLFLRFFSLSLLAALMLFIGLGIASAQAVAEYAGAASTVGASVQAPGVKKVLIPSSREKSNSFHLATRTEAAPEEANRRALEESAGKDAGKLLLRSEPGGAKVWIDGKVVGSTPLLLWLAPGSYKVEMRGTRMEFAQRQVDLLPRETREVRLTLTPRYPARLRLQLGRRPSQTR